MPSFDVVSEVDMQEVRNAVDQASRELGTRFDFRGIDAGFELDDSSIKLAAELIRDARRWRSRPGRGRWRADRRSP